jgi:hypothetical protein
MSLGIISRAGKTYADSAAYDFIQTDAGAYPGVSGGPSLIGGMNLAGAPAVAVPSGFGENHLPTSIQFIAAPLNDRDALGIAAAYQMKTNHHLQKPPLYSGEQD